MALWNGDTGQAYDSDRDGERSNSRPEPNESDLTELYPVPAVPDHSASGALREADEHEDRARVGVHSLCHHDAAHSGAVIASVESVRALSACPSSARNLELGAVEGRGAAVPGFGEPSSASIVPYVMSFDPIVLANEAPDETTFDRAVLELLERSIGFDAAFLAIKGEPATVVNVDGKKLDAAIARDSYLHELAPMKTAAVSRRGVVVDTEVLGEPRVRGLQYHRDFAAPIRGRHSLLAFLSVRGTPIGALMLGRCGSTFSDEQIALVEKLLPSLAVARASFHLPWCGGPLPTPLSSAASRLAGWLRGEQVHERLADHAPEIVVRDRAGYREMVASDDSGELVWSRSALDEPERSGWFYIDLMHLAAVRAPRQRRFLFIGSGGGVSVRQFARVYPGATLDVVEPDERVVDLARRWFGLDAVPNLSVTVDDGASFLRRAASEIWDAIVVDAYDGSELAAPLTTRAFFADVRRTLRFGGGLAFNVIGALGGTGVQRIERSARAELEDVRLVPVLDPGEAYSPTAVRNVVVVARR